MRENKEINLYEDELDTLVIDQEEETLESSIATLLERIEGDRQAQQQQEHTRLQVKRLIEALFFSTNEPLPFNKIREITDSLYPLKPSHLKQLIQELKEEYIQQNRAYRLEEIAQGFILRTCEELAPFVQQLYRNRRTEKLSSAATEVLAIIAYKQPITRPQIEAIRGVDSSGTLQSLLERELIEAVGRLEAPGRPTLYGITQEFLKHFGLKDLEDLRQ